MQSYSLEEIAKHNKENDCWVVIGNKVYDVSNFMKDHPGGKRILIKVGGTDSTSQFKTYHNESVLLKYGPELCIGTVKSSDNNNNNNNNNDDDNRDFGSALPFSDPYWYKNGFVSPYYKQTHKDFRAKVRNFVDSHLIPYVNDWDEQGTYPIELHKQAYEAGIYGAIWPKEYGGTPPEDFDMFHDLIYIDEMARCGAGGVLWSCFFCFGIALPPVLSVGSDFLKELVAREIITGNKVISLAVSEPYAGSDVANLQTTAVKEGDNYIVNGEKKFITGGMKASYFTTAVRTGGKGMGGVSLLLIPKDLEGVNVRRMKTQGWLSSNTTYIVFDNVKVPSKYLIGKENVGFKPIMKNFNHERFVLAATSNRYSRVCLETAIKFARERITFNKRLIDHQVIRHKIANMARLIDSTHAWIELIAYQMKNSENIDQRILSGNIALLKVQCTKIMEFCTRECSQILGGASCIRGGNGAAVERLSREVRINAIGGGSEEILMDLAMRQAKL
eukprot:TRINITY_DN834_c2_g2_i1.p1 TRINITY_DN834_c2_g2~~TRINITY_DN834_c2_g2_i1.p1  ORF type:complete len:502 (-),score=176.07 TRINITY_DN834_c2_g2_i1:135-1640(-)